jgi:uncharacterized glyoxalase superfamily protein PhnB
MRPNIFPVIRYKDAPGAVSWLSRAFGFEKQVEFANPDGTIAHAEIRRDAGIVGISSDGPATPGNPWSSVRQGVYVKVGDVDAHHERARRAGAEIVRPLADTSYGSREYSARDLDGRLWAFGSYDMGARPGTPNIFPELRCSSGPRAIAWLREAFGLDPVVEIAGPDGTTVHAELRLDDGIVMLATADQEGSAWGDQTQAISVRVNDPDALFEPAVEAGAKVVLPLTTTHYGARHFWVRDPEGFLWGFSTYQPGFRLDPVSGSES